MNNKWYLGLGAAAVAAGLLGLITQFAGDANAQVTADRQNNQSQSYDATNRQQDSSGEAGRTSTNRSQKHGRTHKASDLIGMNVRGRESDDDIGSIDDLMIGEDGRVIYAAVSFGGFLGLGDKLFAVPFDAIELVKTDDESYARIDVTEKTMENMEGFNQDNWPEQPNRRFAARSSRPGSERPNTDVDVDVTR